MKIELKNVCPVPMRDVDFRSQSIWNKSASFGPEGHSLVKAPSGTGKSSLVAFMFGMRKDYQGEIFIDGINADKISLLQWTALRKNKLSCVFQDLRLIGNLTVGDNLLLKNKLTNHKSLEDIRNLLEKVGMQDKWNQTCRTLSLGQQQRLAIVRGLLQPFEMLILDEPFSHLDEDNIAICSRIIEEECRLQEAHLILFSLGSEFTFHYQQLLEL